MNDANWHYIGSFGQLGPLTLEQMEELVEGGVIERETYVWQSGMGDWLPAGSVFALESIFRQTPPTNLPPPFDPRGSSQRPPNGPQVQSHQPNFQGNPQGNAQFNPYANGSSGYGAPAKRNAQNFGHPHYGNVTKSPLNRTLAGILQLIPGAGRIYLGYGALGVIQFALTVATCGLLGIWSLIDGALILTGQVRYDGYGRSLED